MLKINFSRKQRYVLLIGILFGLMLLFMLTKVRIRVQFGQPDYSQAKSYECTSLIESKAKIRFRAEDKIYVALAELPAPVADLQKQLKKPISAATIQRLWEDALNFDDRNARYTFTGSFLNVPKQGYYNIKVTSKVQIVPLVWSGMQFGHKLEILSLSYEPVPVSAEK